MTSGRPLLDAGAAVSGVDAGLQTLLLNLATAEIAGPVGALVELSDRVPNTLGGVVQHGSKSVVIETELTLRSRVRQVVGAARTRLAITVSRRPARSVAPELGFQTRTDRGLLVACDLPWLDIHRNFPFSV